MLQRSLCAACSARYTRGALSLIGVGARHSSTSSPGPSRSHIFNEPLDPASRPKSLRRQRQLEQIATARNEISLEEREERARWNADPWYRISRTPVRQCAVTRQKMPSGVMINYRPARPDDVDPNQRGPPNQLLPDRVLHPRYAARKAGSGMWTICHRDIISRLAMGGPHHQQLAKTRSTVSPDIAELVYAQLCERVEQELGLLRDRMQSSNVRSAKRGIGVDGSESQTPVVLRRLSQTEAELTLDGRDAPGSMIAVFDLRDIHTRTTDHASRGTSEGHDEEIISVLPDVSANDLRMLGKESRIPLYALARIFPLQRLGRLHELFESVLRVETLERKRARRAAQGDRYQAKPFVNADAGMSDLISLHAYPKMSKTGRAGDIGVDLAIAFCKLRCFFGQGWEEFDVDRAGRKV